MAPQLADLEGSGKIYSTFDNVEYEGNGIRLQSRKRTLIIGAVAVIAVLGVVSMMSQKSSLQQEQAATDVEAIAQVVAVAQVEALAQAAAISPVYTKCADEDGTCACNGVVRYGKDTAWKTLPSAASIACNSAVFGDPVFGTVKECQCQKFVAGRNFVNVISEYPQNKNVKDYCPAGSRYSRHVCAAYNGWDGNSAQDGYTWGPYANGDEYLVAGGHCSCCCDCNAVSIECTGGGLLDYEDFAAMRAPQSIRLVQADNAGTPGVGRVEVFHGNEWGTICDDSFEDVDASVVCRQLGFSGGTQHQAAYFGAGSGPIWLDNVGCTGSEASVQDCPSNGWGNHNCGHHEDVGVTCSTSSEGAIRLAGAPATKCADEGGTCACNGIVRYGSGSSWATLSSAGSIGCNNDVFGDPIFMTVKECLCEDATKGRVEIYHTGEWGTVCDDSFGDVDASVICKQLGLTGGTQHQAAHFGAGSGPIWLDNVECIGSEGNVESCASNGWGNHNCGHGEDVGITCNAAAFGYMGKGGCGGYGSTCASPATIKVENYMEWGNAGNMNWHDCMATASKYGTGLFSNVQTAAGWRSSLNTGDTNTAFTMTDNWSVTTTSNKADTNFCVLGRSTTEANGPINVGGIDYASTNWLADLESTGIRAEHDRVTWVVKDYGLMPYHECLRRASYATAIIIDPSTIGEAIESGVSYHQHSGHSCNVKFYTDAAIAQMGTQNVNSGDIGSERNCMLGVAASLDGVDIRGELLSAPCFDFSDEVSVESCTGTCQGSERTDCPTAACAVGYSNYGQALGICEPNVCNGAMGPSFSNYAGQYLSGYTTGDTGVKIICNEGYSISSGSWEMNCGTNGQLSFSTCTPNACADASVANSNYARSLSGTTNQNFLVTCDAGYSGNAWATCLPSGSWTLPQCTANPCAPDSVANSNYDGRNGPQLFGVVGSSVDVVCNAGYAGGGSATCGTNMQWTKPACVATACTEVNVPNSNYKSDTSRHGAAVFDIWSNTYDGGCTACPGAVWGGSHDEACRNACKSRNSDSKHAGYSSNSYTPGGYPLVWSTGEQGCGFLGCTLKCHCAWDDATNFEPVAVRGTTGEAVKVTCDAGYSGSDYAVCQPNGKFSVPTCSTATCASTQVADSNWAAPNSIFGTVGQTTVVTCVPGYSGGGEATCQPNLVFNSVTCSSLACVVTEVPDSDMSAPGSITGSTGQAVAVTCNEGFFGSGKSTCGTDQQFSEVECLGFAFLGLYKEEGQIPGWPESSCDEGADTFDATCGPLEGDYTSVVRQCAKICEDLGEYAYFDIHDSSSCFCGKGTNAVTAIPYHEPTWREVASDPKQIWKMIKDGICEHNQMDMSEDDDQCYKNLERSGYDETFGVDSNTLCLDKEDCLKKCEVTPGCGAVDMHSDKDQCYLGGIECHDPINWNYDNADSDLYLYNGVAESPAYLRNNECAERQDFRALDEDECRAYANSNGHTEQEPFVGEWPANCAGCVMSDGAVAFNALAKPDATCANDWQSVCVGSETVTCELTIDNTITGVTYNGESLDVTGELSDWSAVKYISFDNAGPTANLVVEGFALEDDECGCKCSGLGVTCSSSQPVSSQWHGFTSNTNDWKATGSDSSDTSADVGPVCESTSAFKLNSGKAYTKVWPQNGAKFARFVGSPYKPAQEHNLGAGLGAFSGTWSKGNIVRFAWGDDFMQFVPRTDIFMNRPHAANTGAREDNYVFNLDSFKTSDTRLMGWVDEAGGAVFCLSNTGAWDTAWAVLPADNAEWGIGCNSADWAGRGAYYGDENWAAGWVGVKDTNEAKAGAGLVFDQFTISVGDENGVPLGYQNYHYALDSSVAPCISTEVKFSDYDLADSIKGVTGAAVTITCHRGYSGGGIVTCGTQGQFSEVECTANECAPSSVPNSDRKVDGAITGVTEDEVQVICDVGYSGTEVVVCQDDGTFSSLQCTANPCTRSEVPHSDYKGLGSLEGRTSDTFEVTCDAGYRSSSDGESGSGGVATCETSGAFSIPVCSAIPCAPYNVPFSADYPDDGSIMGVTDDTLLVDCLPGYTTARSASAGDKQEHMLTTCLATATFSPVTCIPIPCYDTAVDMSDMSIEASITGATNAFTDVTCELGYSGSATSTCMPGSDFSEVICTSNPCISTSIPFSDHSDPEAVSGFTTDVVSFLCDRGWSADANYTKHASTTTCLPGCRDCEGDGVFSAAECLPNPCVSTSVAFSDHAEADMIQGFTTDVVVVTCDAGYSKFGEWGSPAKDDITDRHIVEQPITCNPSSESPGSFDNAFCLPNPCDAKTVPHSNMQDEGSIRGTTDAMVMVTCHNGYEIFDGGESGRFSAETFCLPNGTFTFLECAPVSRVGFIMRYEEDQPSLVGVNDDGEASWLYAMDTFNLDYFAPAFQTGLTETDAFVSTVFRIKENTIAFVTGGGSVAEGGVVISLVTDFEGSFYTGEGGTVRRMHAPDASGSNYNVIWEVAGLIGRKAVITVVDADPSAEAVVDDFRMYDTAQGCLVECLSMRAEVCLAEFDLPEEGMTCFYFNGNTLPYVPSKKVDSGLTQYCQMGEAPFGENGQASLLQGFEEGIVSTKRIKQFPHLPVCVFIQPVGPTSFGMAVSPDDPIFVLDTANAPGKSTDDNLHCVYETSKPRCAAFDGVLKGRLQHNLFCHEISPELSCMELVYEKKCESGMFCGTDHNGMMDMTTMNLMKCCDRANNDPGSGCLARRRRRLSEAIESKEGLTNAMITDVDASEACAEACLRRANGPMGLPLDDACVAWRLDEDSGECVITTECLFAEMADYQMIPSKLWNTMEGVEIFKDKAKPAPTRVRRRYDPSSVEETH